MASRSLTVGRNDVVSVCAEVVRCWFIDIHEKELVIHDTQSWSRQMQLVTGTRHRQILRQDFKIFIFFNVRKDI